MLGNLGKLLSSDLVQTNCKDSEEDGEEDVSDVDVVVLDDDYEYKVISHDTWHLNRYCCQRGRSLGRVLHIYVGTCDMLCEAFHVNMFMILMMNQMWIMLNKTGIINAGGSIESDNL